MVGSYNPRSTSNYGNFYLSTAPRVDILDNNSLKIQYNRNRYYDQYVLVQREMDIFRLQLREYPAFGKEVFLGIGEIQGRL